MEVKVTVDLSQMRDWQRLSTDRLRQATTKALNDTAFKVQKDWKDEMRRVFDRPTPYVISSVRVEKATDANQQATIEPKYMGGKGVDPAKVLAAEMLGGPRRLKRSEVALQRAGILPSGYYTVPGEGARNLLDAYGNIKGSFIVQLLSYMKAFSEQGYRANMTDKRKAKLADRGRSARGYAVINGVEYFVSMGNLRGGKTRHLHAGIWARSGIHGSVVKPILMFVKQPQYKVRVDLNRFANPAALQDRFARNLQYQLGKASA